MRKIFFPLVSSLLFFSCSSHDASNDGRTVFRYNEIGGITSLDPASAKTVENIWAVNQMFNGLVQLDDNLNVIPCIAESWEISENNSVYTFHIRNDVFFHNHPAFEGGKGRKVVASDFVHTFFRLSDESTDQAPKYLMKYLDHSEKGKHIGCDAPNDSTFVIYLEKSFPPFLQILTMQYFSVIPHEVTEVLGEEFRRNPVGTGPFKFKVWEEGVKLVLEKNLNYFEYDGKNRLPYLDAVAISFVKDKQSALMSFTRGGFDLISGADVINSDQVFGKDGEFKDEFKGKIILQKGPYLKTDYLGFLVDENLEIVKNSPLKSKMIRKAINYAIDRQKIITFIRHNIGKPANSGFVPAGMPSFDSEKVKGYEYNPDKARKLLADAGFPQGKSLPEIVFNTTEQFLEISEFIQSQLSEVGIKMSINVNKAVVLSEQVASSKYNFFRKNWVGDYADAQNFLSVFYSKNFSPNGPNYVHFKNRTFDKLYENSLKETDDESRFLLYQKMDSIVIEEAPVVPLFYDEMIRLVQPDIENLTPNAMNLLTLKKVKKTSPKAE